MIPALAFVPPGCVIESFEELCDGQIVPPEAQCILDYFEDTWIGRPSTRRQRKPPQFAINIWNCYEVALQGASKTNNAVEGWHYAFEHQVSANHPNIWKFIDCLKREQSLHELQIEQLLSGQTDKKKKYRDAALRLQKVVEKFDDTNILDYLRAVAHNITIELHKSHCITIIFYPYKLFFINKNVCYKTAQFYIPITE
ncbi:hypothetical protein PPYR_15049 [Photinus pyralis]|uniref:Uncharacterized protein n=1 Tax=Photinus pyralis TaxID=7054 RepID=A0A5N3ZZR2_PHOPY|nr:hypothetical protein PPYR_15049 [Photinus pyralis]